MNQMGYVTHPYGSYHSLAQAGGMGGAMMTSQMAMMGQQPSGGMGQHHNGVMGAQGVMAQSRGVMSSPYMTGMPQGMMGQQPAPFHHGVYGAQHAQQMQWNVSQVCVCVCWWWWWGGLGLSLSHKKNELSPLPDVPAHGRHESLHLQWQDRTQ